ncbi:30S ribosomal protein S14 [Bacteriovoracaceae bacterium]|nr:30S ribosomal protein S14 [Bacteriovoracaceae bacterium]
MAKISTIVKDQRKRKLELRYRTKRAELKKIIIDENKSDDERFEASVKLNKLPRNSSRVRVRNRCILTGRGRAVYRQFGLSRIKFRELAHQGLIPGVTKASW